MDKITYKVVDLGTFRSDQTLEGALNALGYEGWELVTIVQPQLGIFRRSNPGDAPQNVKEPAQAVAAKYRDPETGETWSGRGRMATWLSERVKAGARLEDYLA